MKQREQIAVIGTGSLGGSLAKAFNRHGHQIVSLYNRTVSKADQLASELGEIYTASEPDTHLSKATLIVLTVSDDQIAQVVTQLIGLDLNWSAKTVVHCSGVHTSELLDPVAAVGAATASFHPLQSFGSIASPQVFRGCYFTVEGHERAKRKMQSLGEELGANVTEIDKQTKANLHAAAAMASNYLVALLNMASGVATTDALKQTEVLSMLMPLVQQTLSNMAEHGPVTALSGPIDRGDLETVQKHLALLAGRPKAQALYRQLGQITCEIAGQKHPSRSEQLREIAKLLEES